MAKTYNRLELDVNKKPNSIGIRPVQGDTKSRYLDVCLYENGAAINLTGEQVRITFRKADGSTFFNQGEVTDAKAGRCQFALTNEILAEAKALEAQISVWNAGGEILSTEVFEIYVSAAIPWTDAVESENEYGVLVVLFQEIQNALDTMQAIRDNFGEPGDKAAEYGVSTLWGILEMLAQRGDVDAALEKKVKAYLNSTVGTGSFLTLDEMICALWGGASEYTTAGTYQFTVPKNVKAIKVTACGGGGAGAAAYNGTSVAAGGGGGSGGVAIQRVFSVKSQAVISIKVGSGGKGTNSASSSQAVAANGEATVVGTLVTLAGGRGGTANGAGGASAGEGSGAGGTGTQYKGSTSNTAGSNGLFGKGGNTGGYAGGGGGSIGDGGSGGDSVSGGQNGTKGGGGGGASKDGSTSGVSSKAGNGGDGYVKIEWGLAAV